MTGHAYATSARTAARMGPFAGYAENARAHARACCACTATRSAEIDEELVPTELLVAPPRRRGTTPSSWAEQLRRAQLAGHRCSRPTGTIGLLMDCDTTGIEPDLGLVQDEEAGRRRHDVDRQPDRAPGAAPARLHRRRRSTRSSPTSTSTSRSSARPHLAGRAPAGVRLLDGRQRHPLPRAT